MARTSGPLQKQLLETISISLYLCLCLFSLILCLYVSLCHVCLSVCLSPPKVNVDMCGYLYRNICAENSDVFNTIYVQYLWLFRVSFSFNFVWTCHISTLKARLYPDQSGRNLISVALNSTFNKDVGLTDLITVSPVFLKPLSTSVILWSCWSLVILLLTDLLGMFSVNMHSLN